MSLQRPRKPTKLSSTIVKIYDTVHAALWAVGVALVIFFCVFTLPGMMQFSADLEAKRIQAIAAENKRYCEKWHFPAGTHEHSLCVLDLNELRAKIQQRQIEDDL